MTESTVPKARKPFRGRRPRRPGQPSEAGAQPGPFVPNEGEGGDAAAVQSADVAVAGEAVAADGQTGAAVGPRPPRPQGGRRNQRPPGAGGQGQGGPRPARDPAAAGNRAGEGQGRPESRPFPSNDPNRGPQQPGNRQGKGRFDRGQTGRAGGGQGGGPNRGNSGQPAWVGKSGGSPQNSGVERGNERSGDTRRNRGIGGAQFEPPVRLSALIVDRGLCTRRDADNYIERGWIFVNGERVNSVAARVHPAAELRLAPEARGEQPRGVTIVFNKPVDCLDGMASENNPADGEYDTALALIAAETLDDRYDGPSFHASHLNGLTPAGGLDVDSMGFLVLTQDERVVSLLAGDTSTTPMEYIVGVEGALADGQLEAAAAGIEIDGEVIKPLLLSRHGENQLKIVLAGGKEAPLHRLCAALGLTINSVKRVRIGDVRLGDVPQGKWRYLRDDESF